MVEYVPTIWLLMAVLFPIALLSIGVINIINKGRIREEFIKLFIAFLSYVPITVICAAYLASLINSIEDAKGVTVNGIRLTPTLDSISLGLIFGHILFGLFLCWFVSKDLMKILVLLPGNKQKTQSIIDTK